VVDLKFVLREIERDQRISNPEPHQDHELASIPIESEIRAAPAGSEANFGFGTLAAKFTGGF
jgi:hypothetical protein